MKKHLKFAAMILAAAVLTTSCNLFNRSDIKGFKKTKSGLHYKIEQKNDKGEKPHVGDVIVGEMVLRLDTNVLFSNEGNPGRLMMINDSIFDGHSIDEGLMMMHEGEKAVFAIYADSIARFFQESQMPPMYKKGTGMIFYYEVTLNDVISHDELMQEMDNFRAEMKQRQEGEASVIAQYIADNKITAQPNDEGLYVIVNKKGNGPKVAAGKEVAMNYTGRLLDGKIFDSNIEKDAKEAGIFDANRPCTPLTYTVGKMSLIKGWDDGVMGMTQGSNITLIIPSSLAYGERGAGNLILPYSPLRFDIDIISVK